MTQDHEPRAPRTERGRRTRRTLLDAAAHEFGERGYHESSIVDITRRAGVALGSFYTYFSSKDAIFRALVRDFSDQVRGTVGPVIVAQPDRLSGEEAGVDAFLAFVRAHPQIYRVIDEAEFVDPKGYRQHYETIVAGYLASLKTAAQKGEIAGRIDEVHAWAIVGMNVFLGLRYGVWTQDRPTAEIAAIAATLLRKGLAAKTD